MSGWKAWKEIVFGTNERMLRKEMSRRCQMFQGVLKKTMWQGGGAAHERRRRLGTAKSPGPLAWLRLSSNNTEFNVTSTTILVASTAPRQGRQRTPIAGWVMRKMIMTVTGLQW